MLTADELQKFADYCEREARDSALLAEQALKLFGNAEHPAVKMLKVEELAFSVVARKLRNTEITSI